MVLAPSTTTATTVSVLMGRTSRDPGFQRLADRIRKAGCEVIERASSPIGAHSSVKDADELLEGVDLAILAVRKTDDIASFGTVKPFQRIARDAGLLQGRLGMDRVVLLVEADVEGLTNDLGVHVVRFPAGQPEMAEAELKRRIQGIMPEPERGMHSKLAAVEASRADNLLWPLLLVVAVAFLAMVAALAVMVTWTDSDPDTAQILDVSPHLRPGAVPVDGDGLAGADPSATTVPGAAAPNPPAGPGAFIPGAAQGFPVVCQVPLPRQALPTRIGCAGAGAIVVTGSSGPWHNEVAAVILDDGVAGLVEYERDGSQVALDVGTSVLDRDLAAFGINHITLTFSAEGQHAHLIGASGNGQEADLVFRLDG